MFIKEYNENVISPTEYLPGHVGTGKAREGCGVENKSTFFLGNSNTVCSVLKIIHMKVSSLICMHWYHTPFLTAVLVLPSSHFVKILLTAAFVPVIPVDNLVLIHDHVCPYPCTHGVLSLFNEYGLILSTS